MTGSIPVCRGVVLVSTLLVLAIISVVALFHMENSRYNLRAAAGMKNKEYACIHAKSVLDRVKFRLLTKPDGFGAEIDPATGRLGWNLFSEPFELDGATVYLQDLAGYIGVGSLGTGLGRNYLKALGWSDQRIDALRNSLADWQDSDDLHRLNGAESSFYEAEGLPRPTNLPLQSVDEITNVRGYDRALEPLLRQGLQVHNQTHFNPLNAPRQLLVTLLGEELAEQVYLRRQQGQLTAREFRSLTGLSGRENMLFSPGQNIGIRVEMRDQSGVYCQQKQVLERRGSFFVPYTVRGWR